MAVAIMGNSLATKIGHLVFILLLVLTSFQSFAFNGQVSFTLIPITKTKDIRSWSIVFPNSVVKDSFYLSLIDNQGNVVEATFDSVLLWPKQSATGYLRSVLIKTTKQLNTQNYTLKWQNKKSSNIQLKQTINPVSHHANLSANWLSQTFYTPMLNANAYEEFSWFDNANAHYANFVISPVLFKKREFSLKTAAPWLYDRPLALFMLYLKTGDLYWKILAHEAALNYKKNVDKQGNFSLKPNDMKYSNTQGLLLDYLFYPNQDTLDVISSLYKKTLEWQTTIKKQGFWTERHHSIALSTAISYWAIFNDKLAFNRIESFNKNLLKKLQNNICLSHPYESHEGRDVDTDVCSPWMTALLIEQLWRFHHLSYSYESVLVISKLSDFLADDGLFYYTYGKEYSAVPKYLTNLNNDIKENNDPWSDINHACDVSSALAKGLYLNKLLGHLLPQQLTTLNQMLKACYRSMHRSNPNVAWPIVPMRKFNWWYTTSGSFTWLMRDLEIKHPRRKAK